MKKEMLINVLQPEECRIAIVENGVLEELYVERTSQESYVGNIYKGRIVNIEPSIQAAFVDFGIGRNGFLHVSDVDPAYYRHLEPLKPRADTGDDNDRGARGRRGRRNDRGDRSRSPRWEAPPVTPSFDEEMSSQAPAGESEIVPIPDLTPTEALSPEVAAPPPPRETQTIWGAALEILGLQMPEAQPPADVPSEPPAETDIATSQANIAESATSVEEPTSKPSVTSVVPTESLTKSPDERNRGGRHRRSRSRDQQDVAASRVSPPPTAEPVSEMQPKESTPETLTTPAEPSGFGAGILDDPTLPENKDLQNAAEDAPERVEEQNSLPEEEPAAERSEIVDDSLTPESVETAEELAEQIAGEAFASSADDLSNGEEVSDWNEAGDEVTSLEERGEDLDDDELDTEMGEESDVTQPRFRPRGGRGGPRKGPRRVGRMGFGRPKPLIQDIFKRGQEVIVQVIKEGIGTKGPTLSTYISIAGRYLVLMPGLNRIGVSRKIVDEEARARLKEILTALKPPKGIGFIIRTAGIDRNKAELQNDLAYLLRLWQVMVRRIKKVKGPAEIYQESDMITRTIRDVFTSDIDTIWVDEPNAFAHAQEFLQIVMPRYADRIKQYTDTEPLFYRYRIEEEIAKIQQKKIPLPMGGSIVIEQTEALVAIDVNSGNFRADGNNAEETAYQMNLQAAKEIARQLRLRDLGGVIVNDFIDMREEKHRRGVERALKEALKRDRARTKILRTSQFGLIEMTRQRIRPSLKRSVYTDCPHCNGTGLVKTVESMSIEVMRLLQLAAHRENVHRLEIRVHADVANYLLNRRRREIATLEENGDMQVSILGSPGLAPETLGITCFDRNGHEVKFPGPPEPPRMPDRNNRERRALR